jgi:tRNA A58 N-methylase Trm61
MGLPGSSTINCPVAGNQNNLMPPYMTATLPAFVLITDNKKFRKVINTRDTEIINLPSGTVSQQEIAEAEMGGVLHINEKTYYVLQCDVHDMVMSGICRQSQYKDNPSRFRPEDRMVAHTGYLLFARALK